MNLNKNMHFCKMVKWMVDGGQMHGDERTHDRNFESIDKSKHRPPESTIGSAKESGEGDQPKVLSSRTPLVRFIQTVTTRTTMFHAA